MVGCAEGIDALLGAACFLIAACAAEGGIELAGIERLTQRFSLHDVGVERRSVGEGRHIFRLAARVGVGDQVEIVFLDDIVAEFDHFLELPARIDVQQREGDAAGEEGLARQVQQHGTILADGIQHHGIVEFGGNFAEDVNGFVFKRLQMGIERRLGCDSILAVRLVDCVGHCELRKMY
ncbi:hypothetical protein D3C80_1302400 [compost metagenome]